MQSFNINSEKYDDRYSFTVHRVSSASAPMDNSIIFIDNNHTDLLSNFYAVHNCIIFVPDELEIPDELQKNNCFLPVTNPRLSYCLLFKEAGIDTQPKNENLLQIGQALVSEKAKIGSEVTLMPGVKILGEVEIGNNTYIGCNSTIIGKATIGKNVIIAENVIIGTQSFSYTCMPDGTNVRMPQFGSVIIEDDVSVLASSIINRGAIEATVVHKDAKISSGSVIGHNVRIGEHCWIIHSHIAGSTVFENEVICSNAQVADQVHVGAKAKIGFGATVLQDVAPGVIVMGNPARQVSLKINK